MHGEEERRDKPDPRVPAEPSHHEEAKDAVQRVDQERAQVVAARVLSPEGVVEQVREEVQGKEVLEVGAREDRLHVLPGERLDPGVREDVDLVVPVQERVGAGAPEDGAGAEEDPQGSEDRSRARGEGRLEGTYGRLWRARR